MVFESRDFYVDLVERNDLNKVVEVYNSNQDFLMNHIGKTEVTTKWISEEMSSMDEAGFYTHKITEKCSGNIIGVIDFKINEETYLSLLMLHNDYKNCGLGKQVFRALEGYVKSTGGKSIRIDVVSNYNNDVFDFWHKSGFVKDQDITLEWGKKSLLATVMRKQL